MAENEPKNEGDGIASSLIAEIDFNDHERWPDELIGKHLLAARVAAEAESRGLSLDQVPEKLASQWVERIALQEAGVVSNIPLEKALQEAARGDFAKAGRVLRAHMFDTATRMVEGKYAVKAIKHRAELKENSKAGADARRLYTEAQREQWRILASSSEFARISSKRRRAALIAGRLGLPPTAVDSIRKAI